MLETPAMQPHSPLEAHSEKEASQQEVPTIICPICDAVYAPSLSQVSFFSPDALEAAFMSMCHFCFRCRRPACPQCWDSVHGVCGECVREANLSFRTEAAPLDSMLFRPLHKQERGKEEVAAALLTCMEPGCFQQDGEQGKADLVETASTVIERISAFVPDMDEAVEDTQHQAGFVAPATRAEISQGVTQKVAIAQTGKAGEEDRGEDEDEDEDGEYLPHPIVRAFHSIESVLTGLALVLLLAIVALVIAAQASAAANIAILHALHVDIRAEVAYLVHLVQQLRQ